MVGDSGPEEGPGGAEANAAPKLVLRGISKRFAGVRALDGVTLEVRRAEVLALVGENGAGKSTLLKVLAGIYRADEGVVEVDGVEVELSNPRSARKHGIAVIHQELNLAPHLSVAENIWVGREPRNRFGGVDLARMRRDSAALLAQVGVDIDPRAPVSTLSLARQQMVEIVKALSVRAEVVVMDEPTSSLTEDEVDVLLAIVRRLRDTGVTVIYVSHRFREVFAISDRVAVLRDGRSVGDVLTTAETSPEAVIALMVGRDVLEVFGRRAPAPVRGEPVLSVRGLHSGNRVKGVDLDLHAGEILGVAGLVGAGRSETALAVFGAERITAGSVAVRGRRLRLSSPRVAIAAGMGLVTEDRKGTGLFLDLPVQVNIAAAATRAVSRAGVLRPGAEEEMARDYCRRLNLRANALAGPIRSLSGGNQQKAVLARWLALEPVVLLLDEPTRGVDIGARAEIYTLIREIAATGVAVLMISSELPEVIGMSDRVLVLREGRVAGELLPDRFTEESIMALATGAQEEAA